MSESPIDLLLEALDRLDAAAALALMAPDCRLLTVDGRRAEGSEAVRALFEDFLGTLRSMTHRVTAQWHEENVWIAEVEADYELMDWLRITSLQRAFVVRVGAAGVTDMRVYGAHERRFADHVSGDQGIRIGGRWMPPL